MDNLPFIWCLVGNVVKEKRSVELGITLQGTKHFVSNTKVYCFPAKWGDGYEQIKVIGRHRKSKKFVLLIMPVKYITNWRLRRVYDPKILASMNENQGWTDSIDDKNTILSMLEWLPDRTAKTTT